MDDPSSAPAPAVPPQGASLAEEGRERDLVARALLAAALALGLARFLRLSEWSLWLDEALTLADSLHEAPLSQKNPLGYLLFRGWFGFLGHRPGELELRLPAAVFGWLGVGATYWAFAPFAGRRAAAAGALLVATSTWHVYWSQTARFYTLAQDLSLLGSGLVLRGLARPSVAAVVAGLAAVGAGCLTHLSGAFVLPPLVAAPLLVPSLRRALPGARGAAGRVLLLFTGVAAAVGAAKAADAMLTWRAIKGAGTPVHLLLTTGFFVTPLLGTAAGFGALVALVRRRPFDLLCLCVCVGILVAAAAASLFVRVSAQYVFVLLPWLAVLAALPFSLAPARGNALLRHAFLALVVLPSVVRVGLYLTVRKGERPQWRAAYALVFEERRPDDLVMGMEAPVGEYYLAPEATDLRDQLRVVYLDRWRVAVPDQWARFGRRTWFVVNYEQLEDWEPQHRARFLDLLAEDCRLVATFPLVVESRDLSVHVFLRD